MVILLGEISLTLALFSVVSVVYNSTAMVTMVTAIANGDIPGINIFSYVQSLP